jgi:cytochrome c5
MHTKKILLISIAMLILMGTILAACSSKAKPTATTPANQPPTATTPPNQAPTATTAAPTAGDGEKLLNDRCTKCHSLDRVKAAQKSQDQWKQTVTRMVGKGANLSNAEQTTLIEYLAKTYGP